MDGSLWTENDVETSVKLNLEGTLAGHALNHALGESFTDLGRHIRIICNILQEKFPVIMSQMFGKGFSLEAGKNKGFLIFCQVIHYLYSEIMELTITSFREDISSQIEGKDVRKPNAYFLPSHICKAIANDEELSKLVQRRGRNWTILGEGKGLTAQPTIDHFDPDPGSLWMNPIAGNSSNSKKWVGCSLFFLFSSLSSSTNAYRTGWMNSKERLPKVQFKCPGINT